MKKMIDELFRIKVNKATIRKKKGKNVGGAKEGSLEKEVHGKEPAPSINENVRGEETQKEKWKTSFSGGN